MTAKPSNPYETLPATAFWRSAVAEKGVFGLEDLWRSPWVLPRDARFSTFGSCFAQHISRNLVARGYSWFDAEPAPGRTPPDLLKKYNFGVFSARTGNIYTAAQLLTWTRLASGEIGVEDIELWQDRAGRIVDMIRPRIEPNGFVSRDEAHATLATTARAFRRSYAEADVFIFTLGLTEGWENAHSGQVYPLCPGTGAGTFDPDQHVFANHSVARVVADLRSALDIMWRQNPAMKVILTVSPVPLVATASGDHVLVATTHSKSILRAAAGEIELTDARVSYFPSYEIIVGPPTRATFFEPNLRSVVPEGVDLVMRHFFKGLDMSGPPVRGIATETKQTISAIEAEMAKDDLVCEEIILDASRHD